MGAKRDQVARAFGSALREARVAADVTQEELAARSKVTGQNYVSMIEAGHYQPTVVYILAFEKALSLAPGELLRRTSLILDATPTAKRKPRERA